MKKIVTFILFLHFSLPPISSSLELFVSSSNSILKYDEQKSNFVTIIDSGLDAPTKITFGPDGHLYVINYNTDSVRRYNSQTYAFIDNFITSSSAGLKWPESIAFGPDGNFYVLSRGTSQVIRYDGQTGHFIDIFASQTSESKTCL